VVTWIGGCGLGSLLRVYTQAQDSLLLDCHRTGIFTYTTQHTQCINKIMLTQTHVQTHAAHKSAHTNTRTTTHTGCRLKHSSAFLCASLDPLARLPKGRVSTWLLFQFMYNTCWRSSNLVVSPLEQCSSVYATTLTNSDSLLVMQCCRSLQISTKH